MNMGINQLIKHFVIDKSGTDKRKQRLESGRLSGTVGISANAVLGFAKVLIGIATGSVAVMADAVNNLSDAASSVVTLIGFSIANKKSDEEHPFGHARSEYMTGVIVSAIVIVVGFEMIMTACEKVINPVPLTTSTPSIILLIIMILAKIWLYRFNLNLSRLIDSASLKATGIDSRNDAITTAAALLAILLYSLYGINIDGFIGLAVGVFIIYSGLSMVKENIGPLLGQSPDPEIARAVTDLVRRHEGVLGVHDLIVHDYGPGHIFATIHIEVDSRENIFVSHELIDDIESDAQKELGISLVGHMDPLDIVSPKVQLLNETIKEALCHIENVKGFHDLRIVTGTEHTNVIFDVVIAHENAEETFAQVKRSSQEALYSLDPAYIAVINRDFDYGPLENSCEPD